MPSLPAGVFQHQQNHSFLLEDSLYCEEEQWEEEEEVVVGIESLGEERESDNNLSLFHLLVLEHDLFWEDEELLSLFPSIISIFAFGTGRALGSSLISTVNVRISESHKRNRIQVSNTKKPLFFYVNLAKRYMQQYNEVELSALGMAIARVVTVAEILKNNGFALNLDDNNGTADSAISVARMEAVEWMLKVNAHYGFTALTAILAINYLDRFLSSLHFQRDKPWMIQLAAVTCLSLAAKVEETQVPLLLDLQVEDTKYVFEAKTIQRMELLVLSTLQWRMNPVTPLSFLDHIIRRLGLKTHLHWEFLRRCERLLLSVVADSRFVGYLPSVLAAATMLHVIHQVDPCNSTEYQNQLLGVLNLNREKVKDCYELIGELASNTSCCFNGQQNNPHKRKYQQIPSSPSNVIDASFSSDSSNDSWPVVSSSPEPLFKKSRAQEQPMHVPSLNRILFVDIVGSPR